MFVFDRYMLGADCEDDENVEVCITEIDKYIVGAECREGVPCPKTRCFQQTMSLVYTMFIFTKAI